MARRTTIKISPEDLTKEITNILKDYNVEVDHIVESVTRKAASMALKETKSLSNSSFKCTPGGYADSWKKKQTVSKNGHTEFVIYNTHPGLPHLLENGHQLRQGGRYNGKKHISVAEKNAKEFYEKAMKEGLTNA